MELLLFQLSAYIYILSGGPTFHQLEQTESAYIKKERKKSTVYAKIIICLDITV